MPKGGLHRLRATQCPLRLPALIAAAAVLLVACERDVETVAREARPVRTITVDKGDGGAPILLTGRIEAEDEVALAFRISGRVVENNMKLGDRLRPGQVVARLEPHNQLNALRTAQASLAAANALFVRARNHYTRQETLVRQGWTSKKAYDEIAGLPIGIEPRLVADQAVTVDKAIAEFMTSLWQAVGIILAVSFVGRAS
jgi:multidrug efflux pump subunit AcrA (membrane-fusion protein)